jgi:hypothetical protein
MVAAFGDLEVRVVFRRKPDALRRDKVDERIVGFGQVLVHRLHHFVGRMRAGDGKHPGMGLAHDVPLGAEAAGDDHLAVFVQGFADRLERLLHRRVYEAAGVDDDEVGVAVRRRDEIAFGAQLRQDALRIDERLGTAERDEAYFRGRGYGHCGVTEEGG